MASNFTLGILMLVSYFRPLWDQNRQALHDKIGSHVRLDAPLAALREGVVVRKERRRLIGLAGAVAAAVWVASRHRNGQGVV